MEIKNISQPFWRSSPHHSPHIGETCKSSLQKAKPRQLISIILLAFLSIHPVAMQAQTLDSKVTYELNDKSLDEGLQLLGRLSKYKIAYSVQQVAKYKNITIKKAQRSVETTLDLLLSKTSLTYKVKDKTLLIVGKSTTEDMTDDRPKSSTARQISGVVTNGENEPLAGVTIRINNSSQGTVTDADGRYSIETNKGDVLVYSFIGYQAIQQRVANKTIYDVQLNEDARSLDEVQVIGYGTTSKRLKTSGVASIKAEEITNQQTSTNFLQAMQGKLSGVVINQSSGGVGTSPDIYIRGVNSITSGNSPLYIVDGVIFNDSKLENAGVGGFTYGRNALSAINPSDITGISVLKDAEATAIYGSRGANGVVLITTKKAEIGRTSFSFDANTGYNSPIATKFLSPDQYFALRKEAFAVNGITPNASNAPDLTTWADNPVRDWPKYLNSNSGRIYNMAATLSGGTKNLSYLASVGYSENHDVLFMNPTDKNVSAKLNVNHVSENNKFKAIFNVNYSNGKYTPGWGFAFRSFNLIPNFPVKDADGNYTWTGGSYSYYNPEAEKLSSVTSNTSTYLASTDLSYLLLKGLTAKVAASFSYQYNDNEVRINPLSLSPTSYNLPGVNRAFTTLSNYNIEPQLIYTTKMAKGTLDALLGSTWFSKTYNSYNISLKGFLNATSYDSWAAATSHTLANSYSKYNVRSWFSRIGYNWDNKYIANFTYRADGSSRFGSNNRWGHFGAVGGAWIFSGENFIKKALPWLSYGKIRSSYGITGNDNIPDYRYLNLFTTSDQYGDTPVYNGSPALLSSYLPNKSIKWEQTSKLEVALENSFLKDRISTSLAYFFNRTTNMLLDVPVSGQTGYSSQLQNFQGVVDNKGFEIEINSTNVANRNFSWSSSFNITFQKNVLVKLPDELKERYQYSYKVGKPLVSTLYYKTAGVNPANGSVLWVNPTDGSSVANHGTTPDWYQYLGSKLPTVFGGLSNTLKYKGFILDIVVSFAKKTMTNALYGYGTPVGSGRNVPAFILGNYWQKEGDNKPYPKLDISNQSWGSLVDATYTNMYLSEGYYFKFQNVSLSYAIPTKLVTKAGINNLTFYVRGQNLGYWTPGSKLGKNPETWSTSGVGLLRSFLAGVTIKL